MTPENKLSYIIPQIVKYQNVDDLLENNSHHSLFNENNLSINDVLKENFVCIVGEPGIGKSRLLDEVKERILPKPFFALCTKIALLIYSSRGQGVRNWGQRWEFPIHAV